MKIENSFTVDAPIDEAWELLTNIPEITPCLPGAKLTDESEGVYSGGVKVKVGPVTAEYKGSAEFVEKDGDAHKAVIKGKGRDTRGAGNAQALISAQMEAVGEQTRVDIVTDLKVSGKVAQFGRGVMQDVSEKLLGQFAECLEAKIGEPAAVDAIAAAGAAAEEPAIPNSTTTPTADAAAESAPSGAEVADDDSMFDKVTDAVSDTAGAVADQASAMGGAAGASVSDLADSMLGRDDDDDALDLLEVAGGAVFKRFLPVLILLVILLVVVIWVLAS
ncbi:MAG: SRPBCC family protein [Acidimicrobiales bacterium]